MPKVEGRARRYVIGTSKERTHDLTIVIITAIMNMVKRLGIVIIAIIMIVKHSGIHNSNKDKKNSGNKLGTAPTH